MKEWISFGYREFYDVPRNIVVKLDDALVLLVSKFSDDKDDYTDFYEAYLLPPHADLTGSWVGLQDSAVRYLGRVDVGAVEFDETRRREINLASLTNIVAQLRDAK